MKKKVEELKPAPYNPRKISDEKLDMLGKSMEEFGDLSGIVFNVRTGFIISGHQRHKKLNPEWEIEKNAFKDKTGTVALGHVITPNGLWAYREVDWDDKKERLANVAANKHGGEFDFKLLAEVLVDLDDGQTDIGLSGFNDSELNDLIDYEGKIGVGGATGDEDAAVPAATDIKRGDLFQLGFHRLLCGDSTNQADVDRLMDGKEAVLFSTDPPYGVDYGDIANSRDRAADIRAGGDGKIARDSHIENDDLTGEKLQEFLEKSIRCALPHLRINTAFYLWHPMLTQGTFFAAAAAADILIHRQLIWVKPSLIMGRGDYHWRHELCFYGWIKGNRPEWYAGRDQDTVWEVARESDGSHPTQKPLELFLRPLLNHTKQGEIVYEPFSGSGSQLIASEKLGRICYAMEFEPRYVASAISRWETFTGQKAVKL